MGEKDQVEMIQSVVLKMEGCVRGSSLKTLIPDFERNGILTLVVVLIRIVANDYGLDGC